ncbi:MAG: kelch repeat-containing protein [Polyangiales bacterium]
MTDAPAPMDAAVDAPSIDAPSIDASSIDAPATDAPVDVMLAPDVSTRPVPSLSTPRSHLGAAVARDGKVYAIGGVTSSTRASNAVEMWDPVAGATSWVSRASLPIGIRSAGVAAGGDGRIYVYGGENGSGPSDRAFAYDPATNTWRELARMARRRYAVASAGALDGRVYALNGNAGAGGTVRDAQAYDPMTSAWATLGSTPLHTEGSAAAGGADGRVYLFGGYDNATHYRDVSVFDPTTGAWTTAPRLPEGRAWHGAALALDGTFHVAGGDELRSRPTDAHRVYDPVARAWRNAAPLPEPRDSFAMVTLLDGRVLAIGGVTLGDTRLATVRAWAAGAWR